MNSNMKKLLMVITIFIVVLSLIYTVIEIKQTKQNIQKSISDEYIEDQNIRVGISNERNEIIRNESIKYILREIFIIIIIIIIFIIIKFKL